ALSFYRTVLVTKKDRFILFIRFNRNWQTVIAPFHFDGSIFVSGDFEAFQIFSVFLIVDLHAKGIVLLVVIGSPLFPCFIKDHGCLGFTRNGIQAVFSSRKFLAVYQYVFVEFYGSSFIGSSSPYLSNFCKVYTELTSF